MRKRQTLIIIALILVFTGPATGAVIDGRLDFLRETASAKSTHFTGSLRFTHPPNAADFQALREVGVVFFESGNGPRGSRTIYPAWIPFAAAETLALRDDLIAVECAWRPDSTPPLFRSRPQIETEEVWQLPNDDGGTLTGQGVTICDIDTGVNFMHPAFFKLSGLRYEFLDANLNGVFNPGDAVDLNGNGQPDPGELLRYRESNGLSSYGNDAGTFDLEFDFLYNDADNDGSRDSGAPQFGETDPCYGELLLMVDDENGNGLLDPGEDLLALGESKVRAIWNKDGGVHTRGVDLLQSELDDWGHGSQVMGIFGGGWPWLNAMSGIAPGVESLQVNYDFTNEPPYLIPVEAGMAWAVGEGADIVLIEDGEWVWEYMDGSSNLEIMINEFAAHEGVIFICPVGNLATGRMHARFDSGQTQGLRANANHTRFWPSFLWTTGESLGLTITPPRGTAHALPLDGTTLYVDGFRIYSNLSISPRGTRRIDLRMATHPEGATVSGDWIFHFDTAGVTIDGYFGDSDNSWYSSATWLTGLSATHTCTWPATADSAIGIAAYTPIDDGDIDSYSGWGPRIDERPCVDIAAPGYVVFSTSPWSADYWNFSGTSSAGPHAAGAAALMKELIPDLDNGACRLYLRQGAGQDAYTGDIHRWGAGKLRINQAIGSLLAIVSDTPAHPDLMLRAQPNPFNPSTSIVFRLNGDGPARLRIFSVDGREVWDTMIPAGADAEQRIRWNGEDHQGHPLGSGVYFAHIRQGPSYAAVKLTLVK